MKHKVIKVVVSGIALAASYTVGYMINKKQVDTAKKEVIRVKKVAEEQLVKMDSEHRNEIDGIAVQYEGTVRAMQNKIEELQDKLEDLRERSRKSELALTKKFAEEYNAKLEKFKSEYDEKAKQEYNDVFELKMNLEIEEERIESKLEAAKIEVKKAQKRLKEIREYEEDVEKRNVQVVTLFAHLEEMTRDDKELQSKIAELMKEYGVVNK